MQETSVHIIVSNLVVGWLAVVLLVILALELVVKHLQSLLRAIKALFQDLRAWKEPR